MKTFAPKTLRSADLRGLMDELLTTPAELSKFLKVTQRSVWRWLADDSCPWPVLALLWHETARGREAVALDVGNELAIHRRLFHGYENALKLSTQRTDYLARLGDFGAANEPLFSDPCFVLKSPVEFNNRTDCTTCETVHPLCGPLGGLYH